LIDIPIKHPGINKGVAHVSYLVTNGELDDTVRVQIDDLNNSKWKNSPLVVWRRGDLLSRFQVMSSGILPENAETYKQLVELMFTDGAGYAAVGETESFFKKILHIDEARSQEQRRRDIAAALLYANLISGPYRGRQNHVSVIRVFVLLLAGVMLLVDRYALEDALWLSVYEIVWDDITANSRNLEAEVNNEAFSKLLRTPLDQGVVPYQKHVTTLFIFAFKLAQLIAKDESWKSVVTEDFERRYFRPVNVWGEASLLLLIYMALLFRNSDRWGDTAYDFTRLATVNILEVNGRKSKASPGLVPPYYDVDSAVSHKFGLTNEPLEENYRNGSYYLLPLLELLARAGDRDFISEQWKEISFINFCKFVPANDWGYYLWECPKGENSTVIAQHQQSWTSFRSTAASRSGSPLPVTMRRFSAFLPFLLAIFPHRLNVETLGYLDARAKV
jgi:hypothetical protein